MRCSIGWSNAHSRIHGSFVISLLGPYPLCPLFFSDWVENFLQLSLTSWIPETIMKKLMHAGMQFFGSIDFSMSKCCPIPSKFYLCVAQYIKPVCFFFIYQKILFYLVLVGISRFLGLLSVKLISLNLNFVKFLKVWRVHCSLHYPCLLFFLQNSDFFRFLGA